MTATRAVVDRRVDALLQGKLVGRVFEWLLPQPVDDCLRVLSSCLLGGKNVTPLMCSTTETIGSNSADDGEDTVSHRHTLCNNALNSTAVHPPDILDPGDVPPALVYAAMSPTLLSSKFACLQSQTRSVEHLISMEGHSCSYGDTLVCSLLRALFIAGPG